MKNMMSMSFLELDSNDRNIIEAIKNSKTIRPIDIARKTGVKRTSVNYILQKLKKRGIIERLKVNGHYEWKKSENKKLENRIESLYEFLGVSFSDKMINLPGDIGVEIFKGKENMLKIYEDFLNNVKEDRIFFIQGNKSVRGSEMLGELNIAKFQNKIKKNKIIMEGILGESSIQYLQTQGNKILNSYRNRLVVAHVVNDSFIDFDMDIIIFKKKVMMINFEKNLVMVIKNEHVYTAIINLFRVMKFAAKKIDLNAYIEKLFKTKTLKLH